MKHGNAESQHDLLVSVLEDYELSEKVKGLCFDTTATITGKRSGTNIRFSRSQGSLILDLACRHHVYELHIKHF